MPKEAKRSCCCCGNLASARTEQRHLQGQAPPRVKAVQAQKNHSHKLLKSLAAVPKAIRGYFSPNKSKATSTSENTPAPDQLVQAPVAEKHAADAPTPMNDVPVPDDVDMSMMDGLDCGDTVDGDTQILADILAGAEQGAWGGPRPRRATVEDDESDDEDGSRSTYSMETDTSFTSDWDQKTDGLTMEEVINEDFERELADFGRF